VTHAWTHKARNVLLRLYRRSLTRPSSVPRLLARHQLTRPAAVIDGTPPQHFRPPFQAEDKRHRAVVALADGRIRLTLGNQVSEYMVREVARQIGGRGFVVRAAARRFLIGRRAPLLALLTPSRPAALAASGASGLRTGRRG
jgi:hypothetical protein